MVNAIVERMRNIDWFCNVGVFDKLDNTYNYADSVNDGVSFNLQYVWENLELELAGDISSIRYTSKLRVSENWNDTVAFADELLIKSGVFENIDLCMNKYNIDNRLKDSVLWDVSYMVLEDFYRKYNHGVTFYSELLEIYEAGHFPCGWSGDYPEGKFIIC